MAVRKKTSRGNITASFSTVIGISLVLFMLGVLSLIILNAQKISQYVRENFQVQIYFESDAEEATVLDVQKLLAAEPFTNQADYVSSEDAAKLMEEEVGQDFIDFLGYHPIPPSIDLTVKADYVRADSLKWMAAEMQKMNGVQEVVYRSELIEQVNKNINTVGIVILVVSAILLLVAIALINNTIRLAIYSKRFIIKSMQLVGATYRFITKPFIWRGVLHGLIGGLIASALLAGLVYLIKLNLPELYQITDLAMFAKLFGIVFALSILISWISTRMAVRKYIRMRADQLY